MTQPDLDECKKYLHWQLLTFSVTFKITSYRNLFKITNFGTTTANYFSQNAGTDSTILDFHVALFKDSNLQDACTALPATTTINRQKLQECGKYKRLLTNGRPVSFTWRLPTALKGTYQRTDPSTLLTALDSAFNLPTTSKRPHGIDYVWYDVYHYLNSTGPPVERATITVQATFHTTVALTHRRPDVI